MRPAQGGVMFRLAVGQSRAAVGAERRDAAARATACARSASRRARSRCATSCWRCASTKTSSTPTCRCRRASAPKSPPTARRSGCRARCSSEAGTIVDHDDDERVTHRRSTTPISASIGTRAAARWSCRSRFSPAATSSPCAPRSRRRASDSGVWQFAVDARRSGDRSDHPRRAGKSDEEGFCAQPRRRARRASTPCASASISTRATSAASIRGRRYNVGARASPAASIIPAPSRIWPSASPARACRSSVMKRLWPIFTAVACARLGRSSTSPAAPSSAS